jgi:dTDP-4-amino-4,6-dideoxygalactose transaminase
MSKVPFVDLQAQYRSIRDEIDFAVRRVLESGRFVQGEEVESFENEFAEYCGAGHGIAVNSGTSALHVALLAAGLGAGDEVITVPFTYAATVAAITHTGAKPVLVDIDPATGTMDPSLIERALTGRTKAILPVHLHGRPADMDPILEIAGRRSLVVIEDAAQAHGARYEGRTAGGLGALGCFSFYPSKNLGGCGEGGMVVTSDADYAHSIRLLRDHGQEQKYHHIVKGFNYRMDEIKAAILRVKLRHLEEWTAARRSHAAAYDGLLAGCGVATPSPTAAGRHVYHVYAIRSPRRDALRHALHEKDIETGLHYPTPVHLMPAFADLGGKAGDFPESEKAAAATLSLPMFAELEDGQIRYVAEALRETIQRLTSM